MTVYAPLTVADVGTALQSLAVLWPRWKPDWERTNTEYFHALRDFDAEAFQGGILLCIKKDRRWPAPSTLRDHCDTWLAHNRDFSALRKAAPAESDGTCGICHARPAWAVLHAVDWATGEVKHVERRIMPCDADRHPIGTGVVPFPLSFVRWAV